MAKQSHLHCSFCGRSRDEVKILIAGQEGHICENCVEHAQEIIVQELQVRQDNQSAHFKFSVRKPSEVKTFLDQYVIGQSEAKKILSVAVYTITNALHKSSSRTKWKLRKAILLWWAKQVPVKHCWLNLSPVC